MFHDAVIKWKHFPRYWPFVRGIHRSPHKGQWRGALMFPMICVWINGWVNNREAGDFRRYRAHYDVTVMKTLKEYCRCNAIPSDSVEPSLYSWLLNSWRLRDAYYVSELSHHWSDNGLVRTIWTNFAALTQREQFVYIFTNEDNMSLTWLGKFIHKSFQRRNSLLSIL